MSTGINLDKDVKRILAEYELEVTESVSDTLRSVAKEATRKLKDASPKKSGKYSRGWTYQENMGRITKSVTVYGKKNTYPLAHLLEHGHATRNGKRVGAIVHIKPVEEWAVTEIEKRLVKKVGT